MTSLTIPSFHDSLRSFISTISLISVVVDFLNTILKIVSLSVNFFILDFFLKIFVSSCSMKMAESHTSAITDITAPSTEPTAFCNFVMDNSSILSLSFLSEIRIYLSYL